MTLCVACAVTPPAPTGTVEMRLLPGQSPVADVDGPYAAYSRVGHGVIVRVWPESINEGMVDLNVIVRNTDLETIQLSTGDIVANGDTGPVEILGEEKMVARFDEGTTRRRVSAAIMSAPFAFGGGAAGDTSTTDGVIKHETPTSTYSVSSGASPGDNEDENANVSARRAQRAQIAEWYLGTIDIEPGETVASGIGMRLPDTSQTIILNMDVDSEDHEFALIYDQ